MRFSAFYGWIFVKKFSKRRVAEYGEKASFSTPPLPLPFKEWEGRKESQPAALSENARGNLNSPPLLGEGKSEARGGVRSEKQRFNGKNREKLCFSFVFYTTFRTFVGRMDNL